MGHGSSKAYRLRADVQVFFGEPRQRLQYSWSVNNSRPLGVDVIPVRGLPTGDLIFTPYSRPVPAPLIASQFGVHIPPALIGPLAGVATSGLWVVSSILFAAGGRRLGPSTVNTTRLIFAVLLLAGVVGLATGSVVPELFPRQYLLFALSGLVGLTIGDQAFFTALVDIGPRLSLLIMTTAPLFAAAFGFVVLGETVPPLGLLGIALTLGGVAWVITERASSAHTEDPHLYRRGLVLAVVGAVCQAGGLLLSKQGIGHGWLPKDEHAGPLVATYVRMVFALVGMGPLLLIVHGHVALPTRWRSHETAGLGTPRSVRTKRGSRWVGAGFTFAGAVVGPVLGVWMNLVAIDHLPLGIAQTLCSLSPVLILPLAATVLRERVSPRAVLGALVAVGGTSVLFFLPSHTDAAQKSHDPAPAVMPAPSISP